MLSGGWRMNSCCLKPCTRAACSRQSGSDHLSLLRRVIGLPIVHHAYCTRTFSFAARRSFTPRMCGIIGIFKHEGPANVELYEGLLMLQHRGQDSAGMVTTDWEKFKEYKENGLVKDVFASAGVMDSMQGECGCLLVLVRAASGVGMGRGAAVGSFLMRQCVSWCVWGWGQGSAIVQGLRSMIPSCCFSTC